MPFNESHLDSSKPKRGEPFKDFYDQYFYFLFAANPMWRIGLARLAFEAGMKAQRNIDKEEQ